METINFITLGAIALCVFTVLIGLALAVNNSNTNKKFKADLRNSKSQTVVTPRPSRIHASPAQASKRHSLRDYERHSRYDETDNPIVAAAVISALDSSDGAPRHVDCAPSRSFSSDSSSSFGSSSSFSSSDSGSSFGGCGE